MPGAEETTLFNRQRKTILSDNVYNEIRNAILSGRLEPGERIVETSIAEQMGVSRAPLREALRQLKREGLVVAEAHRETRVVSFTMDDIRELHLIRATLETLAFQLAAKRLDRDGFKSIENIVSKMEEAADRGDATTLAKCDYDMHEKLCQASGLPRLYRVWSEQHVLLYLWFSFVAKAHDGDMVNTAAAHRTLFEAVSTKDDEIIAREVYHHIYLVGPAYKAERKKWADESAWFFNQFKMS
jgi:DNA-binding GntR family transcriptional regulator